MNKGGTRPGSGPKRKYNEDTIMVSFRCPISKADEFKKCGNDQLDKWKVKGIPVPKLSLNDYYLLSARKYIINKIGKKSHVCRTVENARGKFNVLLAQDILGINCEIMFIDGNTLNNERENLKPVNREVEYIY